MGYPSFVAARAMQSRRRGGFLSFITAIAVAGVALGVATLIITLAVLEDRMSTKESRTWVQDLMNQVHAELAKRQK